MAAPFKRACSQAARGISQHRSQPTCIRQRPQWVSQCNSARPFTSTTYRAAAEEKDAAPSEPTTDSPTYFNQAFYDSLEASDRDGYRTLDAEERRKLERVKRDLDAEFADGSPFSQSINRQISTAVHEIDTAFPEDPPPSRGRRIESFFNMGEPEDIGPDDEFLEDDISSAGHAELEQHRDLRELMRIAVWEMPLLTKLSKQFEPERHAGKEADPLRWRYTTYLGEHHPASRKVVVEFKPAVVGRIAGVSPKALQKLAGPRFNPLNGTIKMSCENFETQAMNKRYLADTIQKLIAEAKTNDFADVPLDVRHVKPKPKVHFPKEWRMTAERRQALDARRKGFETPMLEAAEKNEGPVSGAKALEIEGQMDLREEIPIMQEARQPMPAGKMGKKQMGQKPVQRP
ncbi:hypothetical protein K431DRAFT_287377 [Polychaeton citri CBS 116435]|uniref:Small ribosomal subunit protein mS35 mitochondrial conserved domain-containing protein n=1 Tax=Polychaeton citri CBS 116435 TaxID=1314669 RepID=A0A9P4Q5Z3_9PEZI|nr:hypothetical protein K431DRAFT_287377 [Polychaeton citri CBS 116435]